MNHTDLLFKVTLMNSSYARCVDNDELEAWPEFFTDPCLYVVTTDDNHRRGYQAGVIYADTRGMLHDRVSGLREANVYERQRYRHIVSMPTLLDVADGTAKAETPFAVYRIMRDGRTDLFATGRYIDSLKTQADGSLRFAERVVVCDSSIVDTLLAIPL